MNDRIKLEPGKIPECGDMSKICEEILGPHHDNCVSTDLIYGTHVAMREKVSFNNVEVTWDMKFVIYSVGKKKYVLPVKEGKIEKYNLGDKWNSTYYIYMQTHEARKTFAETYGIEIPPPKYEKCSLVCIWTAIMHHLPDCAAIILKIWGRPVLDVPAAVLEQVDYRPEYMTSPHLWFWYESTNHFVDDLTYELIRRTFPDAVYRQEHGVFLGKRYFSLKKRTYYLDPS